MSGPPAKPTAGRRAAGVRAAGLALKLTVAEAIALRNICRVYEKFVPIHRKVGPEEERLAVKLREAVDADPSIVASASAAP